MKARGSEALEVFWLPPLAHLQHGEIKGYYVGYRRAEPTSPYKYETVQVETGGGADHAETTMSLVIQGLDKFTKYTVTVQVQKNVVKVLISFLHRPGIQPGGYRSKELA